MKKFIVPFKYEYMGKYADFLGAKEERLQREDAMAQAARVKFRRELEWMRRQPQARESKSKSRIDAFYKLQKAIKPKVVDSTFGFEGENRRIGGKILSARNINLKFGDRTIIDDFSYDFCKGDRICISGANGAGKVRSQQTFNTRIGLPTNTSPHSLMYFAAELNLTAGRLS